MAKHQPDRNAHEGVQQCPHRPKHPIGRIEGAFGQVYVPVGDGSHGKHTRHPPYRFAADNPGNE